MEQTFPAIQTLDTSITTSKPIDHDLVTKPSALQTLLSLSEQHLAYVHEQSISKHTHASQPTATYCGDFHESTHQKHQLGDYERISCELTKHNGSILSKPAIIIGPSWHHSITTSEIILGRMPKNKSTPTSYTDANIVCQSSMQQTDCQSKSSNTGLGSLLKDEDGSTIINISDSTFVSRRHVLIFFHREVDMWKVKCLGKHGIYINGQPFDMENGSIPLPEICIIEIKMIKVLFLVSPFEKAVECISRLAIPQRVSHTTNNPISPVNEHSITQVNGNNHVISEPNKLPHHFTHFQDSKSTDSITFSPHSPTKIPNSQFNIIDYKTNTQIKPPSSYSNLIAEAINSSPDKKLTLNDIYTYITTNYAYYRNAKTGWQNSIRHNLSLNKAFIKIPRGNGVPGKGMFWAIDSKQSHTFSSRVYSPKNSSSSISSPSFMTDSSSFEDRNRYNSDTISNFNNRYSTSFNRFETKAPPMGNSTNNNFTNTIHDIYRMSMNRSVTNHTSTNQSTNVHYHHPIVSSSYTRQIPSQGLLYTQTDNILRNEHSIDTRSDCSSEHKPNSLINLLN